MGISSPAQEIQGFPPEQVWRGWKKEGLPGLPCGMPAWGMTCSHLLPGCSTHFCSSPAATSSPVGAFGPRRTPVPGVPRWCGSLPLPQSERPDPTTMSKWVAGLLKGRVGETGRREEKEEEQESKMEGQGRQAGRSWR